MEHPRGDVIAALRYHIMAEPITAEPGEEQGYYGTREGERGVDLKGRHLL